MPQDVKRVWCITVKCVCGLVALGAGGCRRYSLLVSVDALPQVLSVCLRLGVGMGGGVTEGRAGLEGGDGGFQWVRTPPPPPSFFVRFAV